MENQLVKVDPKQFGLEENQVLTIEQAFMPKIIERDGFAKVYEQLIVKELTPALCSEATELRRKLVKVRTGIAEIHKTQKAYFLKAGQFVDAWKNKETAPIEQMEEKLSEIEKYFEKIEADRIAKLEAERTDEISKYSEIFPSGLGSMDESVYVNYLSGLKLAYEARIKAEQEAEAERLRLIEVEKENARLKAIEDERIRIENEKLKAEAEAREREIEAERKKQAEILEQKKARDSKRNAELQPYIIFIRKYSEMLDMDEKTYQKEFSEIKKGAEDHWEFERTEQIKKQAEQEKREAEQRRLLQTEREKQAKLEAELKAKAEAEAAEKRRKEAEEKARLESELKAAKAPDKVKLKTAVNKLSIELPKCGTKEADFIANEITSKFAAFKMWAEKLIETI